MEPIVETQVIDETPVVEEKVIEDSPVEIKLENSEKKPEQPP